MDQSCQKVLLVLTYFGTQNCTFSTLPICFFSIKVSVSIAFYLKQIVLFQLSEKNDFFIGVGVLTGHVWQKCF